MKPLFAKWLLVIPALLFFDWIIMIVTGCISKICGANDKFFCTGFCYFGIALLTLTLLFIVYLIYNQYNHKKTEI